jgi:hypothetical protein
MPKYRLQFERDANIAQTCIVTIEASTLVDAMHLIYNDNFKESEVTVVDSCINNSEIIYDSVDIPDLTE